MADNKLEAIFKVLDMASAPLKKIADPIDRLTKILPTASSAWAKFQSAMSKLKPALGAAAELAQFAYEKITQLASAGLDVAKSFVDATIKAAEFRRVSLAQLEILEGTSGAADEVFSSLKKMANAAGQSVPEVMAMYRSMRALGFAADDARDLVAGSLDVKAMGGGADDVIDLVEKIQAAGHFDLDKRTAKTLGGIGITQADVVAQLQMLDRFKGVTAAGIKAAMDAGQVSADEGIHAILSTVNAKIDKGGGLGTAAENILGKGFDASVQRIKNAFDDLLEKIDLTPLVNGIERFGDVLARPEVAAAISAIGDALGKAVTESGPLFDQIFTPGNIEAFGKLALVFVDLAKTIGGGFLTALLQMFSPLRDVLNLSDSGDPKLQKLKHGFELLGKAAGWAVGAIAYGVAAIAVAAAAIAVGVEGIIDFVGGALSDLVGFFQTFPEQWNATWQRFFDWVSSAWTGFVTWIQGKWDDFTSWLSGIPDSALALGKSIVDGIDKGITDAWDGLIAKFKGLVDMLPAAVKKILGIGSPSKVMAQLGVYTMQGFDLGVEKASNTNAVADAIAMPEEMAAAGGAPSGGGSGGGGSVYVGELHVHVHLEGDSANDADPEAIGHAVGHASRDALVDTLEDLAIAMGAGR